MASLLKTDLRPHSQASTARVAAEKTLADQAFRVLRRDIIKGIWRPGERLKLQKLRIEYGIGLAPLREALQRLVGSGAVILEGQRGFRVRELTLAEARDLARARILVEVEVLSLSIDHGDDVWEGQVVAAAHRLEKFDRQIASGDDSGFENWERAHSDFHDAIVAACPSPWLLKFRNMLFEQHEQYRNASLVERRGARDFVSEHIALRDAVVSRNKRVAKRLMTEHINALVVGFEAWLKRQASLVKEAT
jgi:GntR family transcriptional regulator, carbon starvation induced regulator